jgi:hypothetical protein
MPAMSDDILNALAELDEPYRQATEDRRAIDHAERAAYDAMRARPSARRVSGV